MTKIQTNHPQSDSTQAESGTEQPAQQNSELNVQLTRKHWKLAQMGIPLFSPRAESHRLRDTLQENARYQHLEESEKALRLLEEDDDEKQNSTASQSSLSTSNEKPTQQKNRVDAAAVNNLSHAGQANPETAQSTLSHSEAWKKLRERVANCTNCALHETRNQSVFGAGDPEADWLVIGEAPGAEEDQSGEAFVGRAGKLLNSMMASLGLSREKNLFIANILKSRPPNNRDPLPEEIDACWPYLAEQVKLIQPKVVIAVGRIAAHRLIGEALPMTELRGKVHWIKIDRYQQHKLPLIVTYHPAYLMRSPSQKAKAWDDLRLAWQTYENQLTAKA